jgi:nucleotide-binding universal stress UspA family protein
MFRSLVVPLDGSPTAAQALAYVPFVATPDACVTLVGVATPMLDTPWTAARGREAIDQLEHARALLWQDLEARAVAIRSQGVRTLTTVRTGDVTEAILACACEANADLLLMATRGARQLPAWMLGSVAQRLLHVTTQAMLVVHAAPELVHEAPEVRSLIVPLDGWGLAESALPVADELAERLDVPLRLIRVVPNQGVALGQIHSSSDAEMVHRLGSAVAHASAAAEQYIESVVERLRTAGRAASGAVLVGDPAPTLSAFLGEQADALVVIATHGASGGDWWTFGSVAEKLVTTAPNPILIVRPLAGKTRRMRQDPAIAERYPD